MDDLIERLRPYLETARASGGEIIGDVGSEIGQKAATSVTGLGINALSAVHRAIKNRIGRSKARKNLATDIEQAKTQAEIEQAYRRFLQQDPTLQQSLAALLHRREYLIALRASCEDLPVTELVPGHHRLGDVFIPPKIAPLATAPRSQAPDISAMRLFDGEDHYVIGDAGSGKSSLARWITICLTDQLLHGEHVAALDQLRLPVYVSAAELGEMNWSSALAHAVNRQIGLRSLSELPDSFFDPNAQHGHRLWTVLIDGFDEIDDLQRRSTVFQTVIDLHKSRPENFRFLLFARPGATPTPDAPFTGWQIASLGNPRTLIERYTKSSQTREKLGDLLAARDYRDIARNRLFVAMAATLVDEAADLPSRPYALVEAFIHRGVDRIAGQSTDRRSAILALLSAIALDPTVNRTKLIAGAPEACRALTSVSGSIRLEREIDRILTSTGLVRVTPGGEYRFLHRLIDRHLFAEAVTINERPTADIWNRLDPGRIGWAGVERLCLHWAAVGEDVGPAIEALRNFGKDGEDTMLRLAAELPGVDEEIFDAAFVRLDRDIRGGDLTAAHGQLLVGLARTRSEIREMLEQVVDDCEDSFDMMVAATALTSAGFFEVVARRLVAVASDPDCDAYSRSDAAELLLDHGFRDLALQTWDEVIDSALEDSERLDAAARLYGADRTEKTRQRLRRLLEEDIVEGGANLSVSDLEKILEFGEKDLALPLLRGAAALPEQPRARDVLQRVRAAAMLERHAEGEGYVALEELLCHPGLSLRDQVEILGALNRIDAPPDFRKRLAELVAATPLQIDWRVVDIMIDCGLDLEAWSAASQKLRQQLRYRIFNYSSLQILQHVAPVSPPDEVEALIEEGLSQFSSAALAASFRLIGKSGQARERLTAMLSDPRREVAIDAAVELAEVGAREFAVTWLLDKASSSELPHEIRRNAADALRRVSAHQLGLDAWERLTAEDGLSVADRCKIAREYAEFASDGATGAIRALEQVIENEAYSASDRLRAMHTACSIDGFREFIWYAPRLLQDLLRGSSISSKDIPMLVELGETLDVSLAEMPGVLEILDDASAPARDRIPGLEAVLPVKGHGVIARKHLRLIASDCSQSWKDRNNAIDALNCDLGAPLERLLNATCADPIVPPQWRIALAKDGWNRPRDAHMARRLALIADDRNVGVHIRLKAYEAMRWIEADRLFPDFADVEDLSIDERIAIAKNAVTYGLHALAKAELWRAIACDGALHELTALHELAQRVYDENAEERILNDILALPHEVFVHDRDLHIVLDAIALVGTVDQDRAIDQLTRLVLDEDISIWSIPTCIDRMSQFVLADEAIDICRPAVDDAVALLNDDSMPYSALHAVTPFFERGWSTDVEPLCQFATDRARSLSERIGAATLVFRSGKDQARRARALLNELLLEAEPGTRETIAAADSLMRGGFEADALQLAQICLACDLDVAARIELSSLLDELGHYYDARQLLRGLKAEDFAGKFLTDADKARIQDALGSDVVLDISRLHYETTDDILTKLQDARKLVDDDGDVCAFAYLLETARDPAAHPTDRIEAVSRIEELGLRTLARELFDAIDLAAAEPLWAAELCDRFGRKSQALALYRRAIDEEKDNPQLVFAGLADHRAVEDIKRLKALTL